MSSGLFITLQKIPAFNKLHRYYGLLGQLAVDFWKDGKEWPSLRGKPKLAAAVAAPHVAAAAPIIPVHPGLPRKPWNALPGEVAEKMWGEGAVLPWDTELTEMLIKPLSLNRTMAVLDLSGGLGHRVYKISEDYFADVTGMDTDPGIAMRGKKFLHPHLNNKLAGILPFNPAQFSVTKKYDVILARELFYRVADKPTFFQALADNTTALAQLSFTDYIVDPENRDKPAIKAWLNEEQNASPIGLVEMAEAWAKVGFNLQVYDDQSAAYKSEIKKGIMRFAATLALVKPGMPTRNIIVTELQLWTLRMAAMEQGMKFYRIYGNKV